MSWSTDWSFGNKTPTQMVSPAKEDPQARYLQDALKFASKTASGIIFKTSGD